MMLHEFSTNTTPTAFFPKAMGNIHLLNTLRQKVGKAFPVGGINNSQSGMSIHQKHEERLNFEDFFRMLIIRMDLIYSVLRCQKSQIFECLLPQPSPSPCLYIFYSLELSWWTMNIWVWVLEATSVCISFNVSLKNTKKFNKIFCARKMHASIFRAFLNASLFQVRI